MEFNVILQQVLFMLVHIVIILIHQQLQIQKYAMELQREMVMGILTNTLIMQSIHGGGQDLLIHGLKLAKQQLIIVMVIFIRLDF